MRLESIGHDEEIDELAERDAIARFPDEHIGRRIRRAQRRDAAERVGRSIVGTLRALIANRIGAGDRKCRVEASHVLEKQPRVVPLEVRGLQQRDEVACIRAIDQAGLGENRAIGPLRVVERFRCRDDPRGDVLGNRSAARQPLDRVAHVHQRRRQRDQPLRIEPNGHLIVGVDCAGGVQLEDPANAVHLGHFGGAQRAHAGGAVDADAALGREENLARADRVDLIEDAVDEADDRSGGNVDQIAAPARRSKVGVENRPRLGDVNRGADEDDGACGCEVHERS